MSEIRYSADGSICLVFTDGQADRCPTQRDMDVLPVGRDLTQDDIDAME